MNNIFDIQIILVINSLKDVNRLIDISFIFVIKKDLKSLYSQVFLIVMN